MMVPHFSFLEDLAGPALISAWSLSASSLPRSATIRETYSAIDSPVYPEAILAHLTASSDIRTGVVFCAIVPSPLIKVVIGH
jgi:hypothetical protein